MSPSESIPQKSQPQNLAPKSAERDRRAADPTPVPLEPFWIALIDRATD